MNQTSTFIKDILKDILMSVEKGMFYATERQLFLASQLLGNVFKPTMIRQDVLEELEICDTTLRNKMKSGVIPRGSKIKGSTTHLWNKSDIERVKERKYKR